MKKVKERKRSLAACRKAVARSASKDVSTNHLLGLADELISRARIGEITPDEAEQLAKAAGISPLAATPPPTEYDPLKEGRWTLIQAIAWVAWRDVALVREQSPDYRAECSYWVFRSWNQPKGDHFQMREGWFLEPLYPASAFILTMEDARMRSEGSLPASACLSIKEAESELWRTLLEGRLIAEAFDSNGSLIEIPAREWAHLQMFEEHDQQVLKYHPLDAVAFSKIQCKRADLMRLWPKLVAIDLDALQLGSMLDLSLERVVGSETYIPLSLAICWVATRGGSTAVSLRDEAAWKAAADDVLFKVSDGRIEVIGRHTSHVAQVVPRTVFALIAVPHPLSESTKQLLIEETFISSWFFTSQHEWLETFNDQLFICGDRSPAWTHLQVRRSQLAKLYPKPSAAANAKIECRRWLSEEIKSSPESRPNPKSYYQQVALKRFKRLTARQFLAAWNEEISLLGAAGWSKAGRPKGKSNHIAK